MSQLSLKLSRYRIALSAHLPVASQRIDHRQGLVLSASIDQQNHYVEIAPLSGVDIEGKPLHGFSQETLNEVEVELAKLLPELASQGIAGLQAAAKSSRFPSLAYGLSMLAAKLSGQLPEARLTPNKIPLLYQNSNESLTDLQNKVRALGSDITRVKVKVAQAELSQEIAMIHGILAIRPDLKLRLDANQGLSVGDAIDMLACLPHEAIEYIEEPCATVADCVAVYQAVDIPFALDETLNHADYQFEPLPGLAAVVIKPMLLGDISPLQQWTSIAQEHGVAVILSSSLESSLGIEMIKDLAQQLSPDQPPSIDTLAPFSQDIIVSTGGKPCLSFEQLTSVAVAGDMQ
ncbi:o-succinylbenzoate synthase [Shewanella waksmanii]|uniref:o-succinylbenzoate synthase n=1 Tax=Shewanella waksmanii TaxID=213783 RepID=UPI003735CD1D